ncbi:MAG: hypothetical protein Q7R84_01495 [bacterium]|nr:hypothetical protein [bacterium]
MKKYLLIIILAMSLLVSTSAVLAAKGGVHGKPAPGDGDGTRPPIVQPFARAPIAQPFARAPIAQPFL